MPSGGAPRAPRDAAEGPPSQRSRAGLSADLRREVADARTRFEEAALRAEAHRLLGDDAAAAEVLREQERILADVEDRLGRVVSAAVVQRDAEQVLADVTAAEPLRPGAPTSPTAEPVPAGQRHRTPALAGVASMVAILGVATAAVLGLSRGLDGIEVAGVSADATPGETVSESPPGDASTSPIGPAPSPAGPAAGEVAPATTPTVTPDAAVTDSAPPTGDQAPPPSPSPTPEPDLGTVVADLIEAVDGLDEPPLDPSGTDTDAPEEADASAPDVAPTVGEVVPDDVDDGDGPLVGDDGFVPDGSAQ